MPRIVVFRNLVLFDVVIFNRMGKTHIRIFQS